jgi:Cdc6-like AAA superfamily ATPase
MILSPEEFYRAARLSGNPFRPNPVQGTDPRIGIWVGYEAQRRQLIKYLARSRADQVGNVNFIMLYGDYGTGKSHALLWVLNEITNVRKEDFKSLAFYVPTLKKDKGQLTFAGAYREDIVNRTNLVSDALEFRNFLRSAAVRYSDENGIANADDRDIVANLVEAVDLRSFALKLMDCDTSEKMRTVIGGDRMSDYEAMTTFTRLVNLFTLEIPLKEGGRRFKQAVYLMIDEVDDLQRASAKDARDMNDILRHIYDTCPACFGLVIGLSAEVADLAAIFYPYLLERLSRRLHFDTMDRETTVDFVISILQANRVGDTPSDPAFPFEHDAVEAIASSLNKITPRKIINVMQQVLEEARLSGLNPANQMANLAYLDEHSIIDEVLGDGGLG